MANPPPHTPLRGLRLAHSALNKVIGDCYVRFQKCGSQNVKEGKQVLYLLDGGKAGTWLPPKAGTGLPL